MILYHWSPKKNIKSILKKGLIPSEIGIVYLTPRPKKILDFCENNYALFEVETSDLKLTNFNGCEKWEVLCWGHIPPENIKLKLCEGLLKFIDKNSNQQKGKLTRKIFDNFVKIILN